jgi:ABC-type transport system involved in multi-copper enzyme maturation permease subunit
MIEAIWLPEIRIGNRRGRGQVVRRVVAGVLALQCLVSFLGLRLTSLGERADRELLVHESLRLMVLEYFALLVLATPALVAGAIAEEKMRGTLPQLLTTELSVWDIVLGKLWSRLTPIGLLALACWPILAAMAGYTQIGLLPLASLAALTLLTLFFLGSLSLYFSLRCRSTRGAALWLYGILGLAIGVLWIVNDPFLAWSIFRIKPAVLLKGPAAEWLELVRCLNPLHVLDSVWPPASLSEFGDRFKIALGFYLSIGLICLVLAARGIRPTCVRCLEGPVRRARRAPRRRSIGEDPVPWRERTPRQRALRWLVALIFLGLSIYASIRIARGRDPTAFLFAGVANALVVSFIAGVRASGAISGERERQTWESLMITPLETWELIDDKALGIIDAAYLYLAAGFLPLAVAAYKHGSVAGVYVLATLALSFTAMHYMTATGLLCSAESKSSWRSLAATLARGYGFFLITSAALATFYLWLGCVLGPVVMLLLALMGIGSSVSDTVWVAAGLTTCVGLSVAFWRASARRIDQAESWINTNERYGKTLVRSLSRALRKQQERNEARARERRPVAKATRRA